MHGIPSVCLLLWLVTLSLLSTKCKGHQTYYVRPPNSTKPCPSTSEPCHELNYYAQHNTFNTSNAGFVFLPGNHTLNTTIEVENVQNLTLTGDDRFETGALGLPASSSQIHCNRINGTGFDFENLSNFSIEGLVFLECVHKKVYFIYTEQLSFHGALTMRTILNTTISMVTIQQSPGYGMVALNLFGSITDSVFLISNDTLAFFEYTDDYNCQWNNDSVNDATFVIQSSKFLGGFGRGVGGLALIIERTCPAVIFIENITAAGNEGFNGGHMNIRYNRLITPTSPSITVTNSNFSDGHSQMIASGGVTAIFLPGVSNSTHMFNTYYPLIFKHCTFQRNSAVYMSDVLVKYISNINEVAPLYLALFENCTFSDSASQPAVYKSVPYSVIYLRNSNVTISDCIFEDNFGTAIIVAGSVVTFEGNVTFRNNSGTYGGALLFSINSYMMLQEDTHIHFINNHAEYAGGAIYVRGSDCINVFPCFFQVPAKYEPFVQSLNIKLYFENNTAAEYGGTALYGGLLGFCEMKYYGSVDSNTTWWNFEYISGLHNNISASEPSAISSDPIGVCFCSNNIPNCDKKWNNITIYPGQSFNISAITVGQRNGTIRGTIRASIDNGTIDNLQSLQILESYQYCTNLTYTVYSLAKLTTVAFLEIEHLCNTESYEPPLPPKVYIVLQDCPAGFTLTNRNTQPMCDCVPILKRHHISCDINKGAIHRPRSPWIGYYNASHDSGTSGVLYHPYCPLDYCEHSDMDIQPNNSDEQCAFNHSGILCGSCKPGLSLALGTSQCLKCVNTYLTLLIPFGVAGLVLVCLLVICNLTVTEGTLNGLIFYANIIWVNKPIFFPSNNINILTVFIAWVNLDLGIQTCLYDGMDAYGKTWLQFAFPLYIWTIVGLIIYLSRYRAVNRLIGQNAVKVLATLFLLSYAKLQRAITTALMFTFIQYPDGSKRCVWLYDGNVDYFTGNRIPLFLAGLVSLLFMCLPYTLALLLICYVRRIATPRYRLLRWIVRLLPLFDAYTAPYKPRYQFWTGLLLLVRNISFLVFAFNYSDDSSLNLMAIVITSLFVLTLTWSFRAVYKQWPLDMLESSFICNLGAVSVIVLYTGVSQSTSVVVYTSTGIAFATFVGILLYHCYKKLSKTELCSVLRAAARSQLGVGRRGSEDETEPLLSETDSPEQRERNIPHYDPRHFRESMLEQLSDSRRDD